MRALSFSGRVQIILSDLTDGSTLEDQLSCNSLHNQQAVCEEYCA